MTTTTPEFIAPETETKPKKIVKRTKPVATKPAAKKVAAKTPAKKTAAKKSPAKPVAKKTTAAKKAAPVKKVASKAPVKKTVAKKAPAKKAAPNAGQKPWGEFDIHGYRIGSDSQIIVTELLKGGKGRAEVTERIAKKLPTTKTRGGQEKNIPSLISGLLARLEEQGYKLDQSWVVVPPAPIARKMATAAEKSQVTKATKKVARRKG